MSVYQVAMSGHARGTVDPGTVHRLARRDTSRIDLHTLATLAEIIHTLTGQPVTVTGAACHPFSKSWICAIGSVPVGKAYRLQYIGTLNSASASFYRVDGGNRFIYIQLK